MEFATIKALFSGFKESDGICAVLVQHFDKRKIISSSGISLFHSANVYKKVDGVGITLDGQLSAVLKGSVLKFFSFFKVRRIFDLSAHYIEATDADLMAFCANPAFYVSDQKALIDMADSWVRRKVSILTQSLVLQRVAAETIAEVASIFNIVVTIEEIDGKKVVVLPNNKTELKKLLRFLDEDYYLSALAGDHYLSNSKRRITHAS
jgi:hypothetical protein